MRPMNRIYTLALLAASALAGLPNDARATNGMSPICYGTDNCGMGGAGVALGGNAAGSILNPALSGRGGRELFVSIGWLHADVEGQVTQSTGGNNQRKQESGAENFLDGTFALNWKFNDQWAANLAAFPGGGGATEWEFPRSLGAGGERQIRTRYFFFEPSISYTPPEDKEWSFGVGAVISRQDMKTNSTSALGAAPVTGPAQSVDTAMGVGFHLGLVWQPASAHDVSIGASYRSVIWAQDGYDKYKNTFPFGALNMPQQFIVGTAFKPIPRVTLAGDVKYIDWQGIEGIGNPPGQGAFGWKSQFVFLAGMAHELTDNFTWRFGYNYGKSPIDENHMFANFLFPAITEHHLTAGASYKLGPKYEIGASAYYAPEVTITNNPGSTTGATGGNTFVSMQQYGAQVSLKTKF